MHFTLLYLAFSARAPAADTTSLQQLIARALATNPEIAAAGARVRAAQGRIGPARVLPDPMLSVGIQNLPLGHEALASNDPEAGKPDMMTMKTLSIAQTLPYPGKLGLRRAAARHEVDAAQADLAATRLHIIQSVKDAYYELAFVDAALGLVGRNETVVATVLKVAEGRYAVGTAAQQDALSARVQATQ